MGDYKTQLEFVFHYTKEVLFFTISKKFYFPLYQRSLFFFSLYQRGFVFHHVKEVLFLTISKRFCFSLCQRSFVFHYIKKVIQQPKRLLLFTYYYLMLSCSLSETLKDKWTRYEELYEEFDQWIRNTENNIKTGSDLKTTLDQKVSQLHNHRVSAGSDLNDPRRIILRVYMLNLILL